MAKIAIDCDGVLADFSKGFFQMADRIWPGRIPHDYQVTEWNDLGGLTMAEQDEVWSLIKDTPNWWMTLNAYTENVGPLAVFLHVSEHHDIYLVTSRVPTRGATVAFQTDYWLRACGVDAGRNYLGVIATEYPSQKAKLYKAMGMDFSVDDKSETVEECDKLANHTAFLLDRPHNQTAKVKNRIVGLEEMFAKVRGKQ